MEQGEPIIINNPNQGQILSVPNTPVNMHNYQIELNNRANNEDIDSLHNFGIEIINKIILDDDIPGMHWFISWCDLNRYFYFANLLYAILENNKIQLFRALISRWNQNNDYLNTSLDTAAPYIFVSGDNIQLMQYYIVFYLHINNQYHAGHRRLEILLTLFKGGLVYGRPNCVNYLLQYENVKEGLNNPRNDFANEKHFILRAAIIGRNINCFFLVRNLYTRIITNVEYINLLRLSAKYSSAHILSFLLQRNRNIITHDLLAELISHSVAVYNVKCLEILLLKGGIINQDTLNEAGIIREEVLELDPFEYGFELDHSDYYVKIDTYHQWDEYKINQTMQIINTNIIQN
jgi:hypothetical protein